MSSASRSGWILSGITVLTAACAGAPPVAEPVPRPVYADTTASPQQPWRTPRLAVASEPTAADSTAAIDSTTAVPTEIRADAEAPGAERVVAEPPEPDSGLAEETRVEEKRPPAPLRPPVPVLPNALLPRERIVAFYGNPASARMGILGELPPDEMLQRLDREVAAWRAADPATPVRPALQLITVMAAGDPGPDSLFRVRMPDWRIEQVMDWSRRRDALLFLDIQPGRSDVPSELPRLEKWLRNPDVHLALDPEWSMPADAIPGRQIGSMTAEDVNFAIRFLARIVDEYQLPPKVLVVHRFTQSMLRHAGDIVLDPRVQVVINMDGWGPPSQKIHAYTDIVAPEADQFTGFKLFFHNDRKDGSRMLTPEEILQLSPAPLYIQYQ